MFFFIFILKSVIPLLVHIWVNIRITGWPTSIKSYGCTPSPGWLSLFQGWSPTISRIVNKTWNLTLVQPSLLIYYFVNPCIDILFCQCCGIIPPFFLIFISPGWARANIDMGTETWRVGQAGQYNNHHKTITLASPHLTL